MSCRLRPVCSRDASRPATLDEARLEVEVVGRARGARPFLLGDDRRDAGGDGRRHRLGHQADLVQHDDGRLVDLAQMVEVVLRGLRERGGGAEREADSKCRHCRELIT